MQCVMWNVGRRVEVGGGVKPSTRNERVRKKCVRERERSRKRTLKRLMMGTWNTRGKKRETQSKGAVSPAFRVFLEEDLRFPR